MPANGRWDLIRRLKVNKIIEQIRSIIDWLLLCLLTELHQLVLTVWCWSGDVV